MVKKLKNTAALFLLSLSFISCSSLRSVDLSARPQPRLETHWIKPSVQMDFKTHRKMNRMSPLVSGDLIFQANNIGSLSAFDRKTGKIRWTRDFKGGVEAGATLFKEMLFVAANNGTVVALKAQTGEVVWSASSSSENVSIPVLDSSTGLLYFQNSQNIVTCLEADTGRQVWLYSKVDNSLMTIRGSSSPTLSNGVIYAGFSEGSFVALKAATGQVLWEQNLNRNKKFRDIDAQGVISEDQIFISGYDDRLYALSTSNGQILWTVNTGSYSAVTLAGEDLYVSSTNSEILKLNKKTGDLIWKISQLKGLPTQVSLLDNWIVFGESQGELKLADQKTGKVFLSYDTGRGIFARPTVLSDKKEIFIFSNEAYLYSLHLNTQFKDSFWWIQ